MKVSEVCCIGLSETEIYTLKNNKITYEFIKF